MCPILCIYDIRFQILLFPCLLTYRMSDSVKIPQPIWGSSKSPFKFDLNWNVNMQCCRWENQIAWKKDKRNFCYEHPCTMTMTSYIAFGCCIFVWDILPSKEIFTNFMDDSSVLVSWKKWCFLPSPLDVISCSMFRKSGWQLPGLKLSPWARSILEAVGRVFQSAPWDILEDDEKCPAICKSSWALWTLNLLKWTKVADEAWSSSFGPSWSLKIFREGSNWQRLLKKKKVRKLWKRIQASSL